LSSTSVLGPINQRTLTANLNLEISRESWVSGFTSQYGREELTSRVAEGRYNPPPPPSSNRACRFPAHGLPKILSVQGMNKESTVSRPQEPQAEALQMGVRRLAFRRAVGSLTSTSQVTRGSKQREAIQFSEALPGIAVTEISAPAFAPVVDIVDHLADGDETALSSGFGDVATKRDPRDATIHCDDGRPERRDLRVCRDRLVLSHPRIACLVVSFPSHRYHRATLSPRRGDHLG
jgi:hypothetical protein